MKIIRSPAAVLPSTDLSDTPCVASIGNFDGVHRGHQAIIDDLVSKGRSLKLPATLVTFEPHPLEFFAGDRAPPRIMTFRQKVEAFAALKIDRVCCLRFNAPLAATEPDVFIQRYLIDGLGVKHLIVGDDFHFGRNRKGDFALIERMATEHSFGVERAATYSFEGERISSTRIRVCLAKGDFDTAKQLLGKPYSVSGRVMHGDKRGREFGIPTINLRLPRNTTPLSGIFAVRVHGLGDESLAGAGYVGTRPAVDGQRLVLEVHLLDFDGDCYGKRVSIEFIDKVRDDADFTTIDALKAQMQQDIAAIRQRFDMT